MIRLQSSGSGTARSILLNILLPVFIITLRFTEPGSHALMLINSLSNETYAFLHLSKANDTVPSGTSSVDFWNTYEYMVLTQSFFWVNNTAPGSASTQVNTVRLIIF
jgi:hypothetical protein